MFRKTERLIVYLLLSFVLAESLHYSQKRKRIFLKKSIFFIIFDDETSISLTQSQVEYEVIKLLQHTTIRTLNSEIILSSEYMSLIGSKCLRFGWGTSQYLCYIEIPLIGLFLHIESYVIWFYVLNIFLVLIYF